MNVEGEKSVAIGTLIAIGSDDDPSGQSGLAHLSEHMFAVSGTRFSKQADEEELSRRYTLGWGAWTHRTFTTHVTVVEPEALERELNDRAERLSGQLSFNSDAVTREQTRILSEIEQEPATARVTARCIDRLWPSASVSNPRGVVSDVLRLGVRDVENALKRYYRPRNAWLVVAGAIDEGVASALVERVLGSLSGGEVPPSGSVQPATLGIEFQDSAGVEAFNESRTLCIGYVAPTASDSRHAGYLLLRWRLGLDRSSGHAVMSSAIREKDRACIVFTSHEVAGSIDDQLASFEASLDRACESPPTRDERACIAAWALGDAGVEPASVSRLDPRGKLIRTAANAAYAGFSGYTVEQVLKSISALGEEDLARVRRSWFSPKMRSVVVGPAGRELQRTRPMENTPRPTGIKSGEDSDVLITLSWDRSAGALRRSIGRREIANDQELRQAICMERDARLKAGFQEVTILVRFDLLVPAKAIQDAVSAARTCGVSKVYAELSERQGD